MVGTNLNQANPILLVRGVGLNPPRARDSERSARSRECAGSCNAGRHCQPLVSRWTQSHQNLIGVCAHRRSTGVPPLDRRTPIALATRADGRQGRHPRNTTQFSPLSRISVNQTVHRGVQGSVHAVGGHVWALAAYARAQRPCTCHPTTTFLIWPPLLIPKIGARRMVGLKMGSLAFTPSKPGTESEQR